MSSQAVAGFFFLGDDIATYVATDQRLSQRIHRVLTGYSQGTHNVLTRYNHHPAVLSHGRESHF